MTRHFADEDKYIATRGLDAALEVAKVLIKNDYEVHIECDDCDIYIVHFAYAKHLRYGNAGFYRISEAQADVLDHIDGDDTEDYE